MRENHRRKEKRRKKGRKKEKANRISIKGIKEWTLRCYVCMYTKREMKHGSFKFGSRRKGEGVKYIVGRCRDK